MRHQRCRLIIDDGVANGCQAINIHHGGPCGKAVTAAQPPLLCSRHLRLAKRGCRIVHIPRARDLAFDAPQSRWSAI